MERKKEREMGQEEGGEFGGIRKEKEGGTGKKGGGRRG